MAEYVIADCWLNNFIQLYWFLYKNGCGIKTTMNTEGVLRSQLLEPSVPDRSETEDIHAYYEGRRRSPEEYDGFLDKIYNFTKSIILYNIL